MSQKSIKNFFQKRPRLDEVSSNLTLASSSASNQLNIRENDVEFVPSLSEGQLGSGSEERVIVSNNLDIGLHIENVIRTPELIRSLLTTSWKPEKKHTFPTCKTSKRRFQLGWLDDFSWLAYSDVRDAAFCKFCVLFGTTANRRIDNRQEMGLLGTCGYNHWNNALEKFRQHEQVGHHKRNKMMAENLLILKIMETVVSVDVQLNKHAEAQIKENRERLVPIVESILFCGRQCIALRGHRDDGPIESEVFGENDGNLRSLLRFRANYDPTLKTHLETCPANATYYSKTIQNEIIDCIGSLYQQEVVARVNSAKCFSVLADETADVSGIEQLTISVRYVTEDLKLKEDFLCFAPLVSMTADSISTTIVNELKRLNVNTQYLRGPGFDGCSTMKGRISGVNVKIQDMACRQALYVHCSSHTLNLVLSHGCSIPEIRNTSYTIGEVINFFNTPKRLNTLKCIITSKVPETRLQKLIKYCDTRFVQRHDSVLRFIELYDCVIEALGELGYYNYNYN